MWRMHTLPTSIDLCWSINSKPYGAAFPSPLQQLHGCINHPLIHMICPVMMRNTLRLTMWLRQHPEEAKVQPAYWTPPGCNWIHLKHQRNGDKFIQISMITTPTQWRLSVHFGYRK
jgi:hypothetical protein